MPFSQSNIISELTGEKNTQGSKDQHPGTKTGKRGTGKTHGDTILVENKEIFIF